MDHHFVSGLMLPNIPRAAASCGRRAVLALLLCIGLSTVQPAAKAQIPLTDIAGVSTGTFHTCALTTEGGVKCLGANFAGQLGDGTTTTRLTAVDVSGLNSGVAALAMGYSHTCVVTTSGGVKCWGTNSSGQFGDGSTTGSLIPVDVNGLASGISAISAGYNYTCALTTSGGVKCWGSSDGGLGDGTTATRFSPVDVVGLTSGVRTVAAGGSHTCALTTSGGVKCWGRNSEGEIGDGTTTQRLTAVDVGGLTAGVSAIAAGESHTCALTTSGGVRCWGRNSEGQLGDGTTTQRATAVDVSGLSSGVDAIAAGDSHTCALTTLGGVKCWGGNFQGELGDGTTTQRLTAVDVSGLSSGVSAIATDSGHTCAVTVDGEVKCWGRNFFGQLGDGTTSIGLTALDVSGLTSGVAAIATGGSHTCARTHSDGIQCWGANGSGQLGDGTTLTRLTAANVSGLGSGIGAIATGNSHTCSLTTSGAVKCWGWNGSGQLGDGTTIDRLTPVDVSGIGSGVGTIATGDFHTCARTAGNGVKCWGDNSRGQLGDGTTTQRLTAVDVSGLTNEVNAIAAGRSHTCALTTSGGVKCWGFNSFGQLGDGTMTQRLTPVDVNGLTSGVIAIAAGDRHTCALTTGGAVKCWGFNDSGQLGDGTRFNRSTATDVIGLGSGISAIATGRSFSCALTSGGGVKCWGLNVAGQLGDGTTASRLTAVDVSGLGTGVGAIASGGSHSCAVTTGGGAKCWGFNSSGQLGTGGRNYGLPSAVLVFPGDPIFQNSFEGTP